MLNIPNRYCRIELSCNWVYYSVFVLRPVFSTVNNKTQNKLTENSKPPTSWSGNELIAVMELVLSFKRILK